MIRLHRQILLLSLIGLSILWTACDFNVEITDEKRSLNKIGGTTPCDQRLLTSNTGKQTIRVFMIDDNQNAPEAIELSGIDQEPYNLKLSSFEVASSDKAVIKVYSHETGDQVPGAKATVEVDTDGTYEVHPNPRHVAIQKQADNKRVPLAVYLLIDMSDTALAQDNGALRTAVPGSWVLENFNTDSVVGDLDIFATLLVRNDDLSAQDILFLQWTIEEDKYFTSDAQFKGFVYTTKTSRDLMSEKFIGTGNPVSSGTPPMFAAISAAAKDLRKVAREDGTLLFNPNLIAISLERDVSMIPGTNKPDRFNDAAQAVRGTGWPELEDESTADFVPMQAIMWHKPFPPNVTNPPTQEDWDKYVDKMCLLSQAAGPSKKVYFGNVFPIIRGGQRDFYKENLKNALDVAHQTNKGYLTLQVKYNLSGSGIEKGKRYNIAFKLKAKLLEQESKDELSPYIYLTVVAQ